MWEKHTPIKTVPHALLPPVPSAQPEWIMFEQTQKCSSGSGLAVVVPTYIASVCTLAAIL